MNQARILLALPMLLASNIAFAQPAEAKWEADVRKFDTQYWQAFNQCNVTKLTQLNTEDLEFYHDVGGVMKGQATFSTTFKDNICGNPDVRVRREAVVESIRVFPMRDKGQLYGAIISGEHRFYNAKKGRAEVQTGQARFTHMLVLENGAWKVSRVLSFDHGPAK